MGIWLGFALGGLCGGLIKNYLENDRTLIAPSLRAGKGWRPGVLGDLFAGFIAGLATAAVAPLLLSDHLVASMGLGLTPRAGTVPLLVVAVGLGALLGFGWRRVIPQLSSGVAALISHEVDKKTKDLSDKMNQVDEGTKVEGEQLAAVVDTLKRAIAELRAPPAPGPAFKAAASGAPFQPAPPAQPAMTIKMLVDEYENNTAIADTVKRLAKKEELAGQMAAQGLAQGLPRMQMVADYKTTHQEGYLLALASLVLVDPQPGDTDVLLGVSEGLKRLHVKYRVAAAFGTLADRRFLTAAQGGKVAARLMAFRAGADASLLRRIDATLRKLP